jgi:uncharacterized membrane protein
MGGIVNKAIVGLLGLIAWRQLIALFAIGLLVMLAVISVVAGNSGWIILPVMLVLPLWLVGRSRRRPA